MIFKRRELLDDAIMHMRAGRMKRRTFLERAVALGLSMGAATSLLEACGTMTCTPQGWVSKPNVIVWNSEHDDQSYFNQIVDDFNRKHANAQVIYNNAPFRDNAQYQDTVSAFRTCNSEMDVISLDVIWLAEFAKEGWILPLTESMKSVVKQRYGKYQIVMDSCTYQGQMYSAPLRFDLGGFFYNTGLVSLAPNSWNELVESVARVRTNHQGEELDGYVWQGAQYEGLVCNFLEVLAGYGGSFLDAKDPTKVTVNTPEARAALTEMVNWIWRDQITPIDVITTKSFTSGGETLANGYEEADARVRWQNGYAIFMRNWFNVMSLITDKSISAVYDKVEYAPIPHGVGQEQGHSCVGGWHLGVNAASANQELCWQFIDFVFRNVGNYTAADIFYTPTAVFADPALRSFISKAVSRPQLPRYADFTARVQAHLSDALTRRVDPSSALRDLQKDLEPVVARS